MVSANLKYSKLVEHLGLLLRLLKVCCDFKTDIMLSQPEPAGTMGIPAMVCFCVEAYHMRLAMDSIPFPAASSRATNNVEVTRGRQWCFAVSSHEEDKRDCSHNRCDHCGKLLDPLELVRPRCKVDGSTPTTPETNHLFLKLDKLQPEIEMLFRHVNRGWPSNPKSITSAWLREG